MHYQPVIPFGGLPQLAYLALVHHGSVVLFPAFDCWIDERANRRIGDSPFGIRYYLSSSLMCWIREIEKPEGATILWALTDSVMVTGLPSAGLKPCSVSS